MYFWMATEKLIQIHLEATWDTTCSRNGLIPFCIRRGSRSGLTALKAMTADSGTVALPAVTSPRALC